MTCRLHFSGIGGTAMVAGARLAVEAGFEVRGSDGPLYPPVSEMVKALGVPVFTGYNAANLEWGPDCVVIGNALSRGNPEVEAVLSRKMPYVSLAEWLKNNVLRQRRPVVISGTHGKTTTTALTAFVLDRGIPGVGYLIGGEALGFDFSSRLGREASPFVIEGDEYDTAFFDKRAKFLHYLPDIAVVTSVEFDHGDIYRDLGEIEIAFQRMFRQIPREGLVLLCADNHAASLAEKAFSRVESYGFSEGATWRARHCGAENGMGELEVFYRDTVWGKVRLSLAGRHNQQNTLAAIAVAAALGMNQQDIAAAVAAFPGVRRRMEVFLETGGIVFVDDFAHHPTAIRETIAAARMRWPGRRLRVIVEPRSNTMVTNRFQGDLEASFAGADEVVIGPIYREQGIPAEERLDRKALAGRLSEKGVGVVCFDEVPAIADYIGESARPGDVMLVMSNGAFGGIYGLLKQRFAK